MKQRITPSILAAGAALLLLSASCQQEEAGSGAWQTDILQIAAVQTADKPAVQTADSPAAQSTPAATRAATALTTGSIGVWRTAPAGYTGEARNKKYTYNSGSSNWQPSQPSDAIELNATPADVCVYSPYDNAYSDPAQTTVFTLRSGPTEDFIGGVADFCYAKQTLSQADGSPTFTLEHAYAKLELTFHLPQYAGKYITDFIPGFQNSVYEATVDIAGAAGNLTVVTTGNLDAFTPRKSKDDAGLLIQPDGTAVISLYLLPFTASQPVDIKINIDQIQSLTARITLPATVAAGNRYKTTLSQGGDGTLKADNIVTFQWNETDLTPDSGYFVTQDGAIKLPGMYFFVAPGNLVAIYDETVKQWIYSFASSQAYTVVGLSDYSDLPTWGMEGAPNHGNYWNWNVLTPDPTDVAPHADYDPDHDPCKKMGKEWSTPSRREMEELARYYTSYTNVYEYRWLKNNTPISRGLLYNPINQDYIFETTQNYGIYFPATGYRYYSSSYCYISNFRGSSDSGIGQYWCQETSSSSNAYVFYFDQKGPTLDKLPKKYGCSIRCVRY